MVSTWKHPNGKGTLIHIFISGNSKSLQFTLDDALERPDSTSKLESQAVPKMPVIIRLPKRARQPTDNVHQRHSKKWKPKMLSSRTLTNNVTVRQGPRPAPTMKRWPGGRAVMRSTLQGWATATLPRARCGLCYPAQMAPRTSFSEHKHVAVTSDAVLWSDCLGWVGVNVAVARLDIVTQQYIKL